MFNLLTKEHDEELFLTDTKHELSKRGSDWLPRTAALQLHWHSHSCIHNMIQKRFVVSKTSSSFLTPYLNDQPSSGWIHVILPWLIWWAFGLNGSHHLFNTKSRLKQHQIESKFWIRSSCFIKWLIMFSSDNLSQHLVPLKKMTNFIRFYNVAQINPSRTVR